MKVLLVTGGKGGVGKTNIAINLSISLAKMSQKVLLLDADFGLANVDVLLDLYPKYTLTDVFANRCQIDDAIVKTTDGVFVIPSGSGDTNMSNLSTTQVSLLMDSVASSEISPNMLVVDTAAGISEQVLGLALNSDEIMLVVCNEPTSITDAYALMKLLNKQYKVKKFKIIANKVTRNEESVEIFTKLTKVADKFLDVSLQLVASIPDDAFIERAIRKRKAVCSYYPNSKSSVAIKELAQKILTWPTKERIIT